MLRIAARTTTAPRPSLKEPPLRDSQCTALSACITRSPAATPARAQDGKLTISEAVNLLNSPEVSAVVTKTTGMEHTMRTEDEIKKWFERAGAWGATSSRAAMLCRLPAQHPV